MNIQLIAIDKHGERTDISDWLYFFEEQGVEDWRGNGHCDKYSFELKIGSEVYDIVDGVATKRTKG